MNDFYTLQDPAIATSTPVKTFLEKAFLLHELFSVNDTQEKPTTGHDICTTWNA